MITATAQAPSIPRMAFVQRCPKRELYAREITSIEHPADLGIFAMNEKDFGIALAAFRKIGRVDFPEEEKQRVFYRVAKDSIHPGIAIEAVDELVGRAVLELVQINTDSKIVRDYVTAKLAGS